MNGDSGWEFLGLDEPEARVGISTVEVDPSTGTLYAGFNKLNPSTFTNSIAGIFRSTDNGATWEVVIQGEFEGEPVSFACTAVRFHPDTPGTIITAGGVIRMTENGGETWRQISEEDRKRVRSLYIDWQQRKIYAALINPDEGLFLLDF